MVHEQAAGFALDALDADEAAEFERHLAVCPGCEDELDALQMTAAALAFAVDLAVPRRKLRDRVTDAGAPAVSVRRRRQLLTAAVVAAACATVAVGLHPWDGGRSLGGMRRYPAAGARASLLVDRAGGAVLAVRRLPPPPAGKAYEVWVIAGGKALPAGWLHGSLTALTRQVPAGAAVAVSIEPRSGSPRPSGPLLLRAETA